MIVLGEEEPLLPHLHSRDALSRQVRMDGGELATDGVVVDDLLDGCPHLLHALNAFVNEDSVNGEFALVTPGRATSAVFQDFQLNKGVVYSPLQYVSFLMKRRV